jgi:probable F420-dependent oxidoreductase
MKFWQMLTWMEPDQILEVSRFAEEVGFEGVMLGDHGVFPQVVKAPYPYSHDGKPPMAADSWYPDCWATIGAISAVTRRIRFAVSVYVLPLRNVFEVARATGTLAILSGNRFILGAGTGWMKDEFEIYGVDFHTRGKRFDEMLEVLRRLWGGGMVEYHGEHFDFPLLQISPAPEKSVPIFLGGSAPVALKRAAAKADGWIGAGNTPEQVPPLLAEFRRLRREAQREHLPFETVIGLSTPPDLATFQRLHEAGMSGGVSYPFMYTVGKTSSLDDKKRAMEDFARRFIRPLAGG